MDIFKKCSIMKFEPCRMLAKVNYRLGLFGTSHRITVSALYLNNALPKITFIIVKKRHNTRFFVQEPNSNVKMLNNVQPGRCIGLQNYL